MTGTLLQRWAARIEAEHAAEVERGEHDECCESRPNSRLCHCSKRRREAAGYTEPPGELIHQAPLCPRCHNEVNVDADGFDCANCSVSWDRLGITAEFTDDYGDLDAPPPSQQIAADRAAATQPAPRPTTARPPRVADAETNGARL